MKPNLIISKHAGRIFAAGLGAVGAIYADNFASLDKKAAVQMATWTITLFVFSALEWKESLKRPKLRYIAIALGIAHLFLLYLFRNMFPLRNSLLILVYLWPEILALVLIYTWLGQRLDPDGPFGLSEVERSRR